MRERPILFSAPMVRALLDGSKTQTRRVVKPQPPADWDRNCWYSAPIWGWTRNELPSAEWHKVRCPYGQPGDRLWVREAWAFTKIFAGGEMLVYREGDNRTDYGGPWKPGIHMFRSYSRITLEVTSVRVERLQDISEADAIAEGCKAMPFPGPWWQGYRSDDDGELHHTQTVGEAPPDWMIEPKRMKPLSHLDRSARDAFRTIWFQINGLESWEANPWVWVVEFKVVQP